MLKDTIISAFNYDGTLLKWLKKVEKALQGDTLTNIEVVTNSDYSMQLKLTFGDGSFILSPSFTNKGRGIVSITKTATSGLVDTYTVTYTDNTTSTFTVTNAEGLNANNLYNTLTAGTGIELTNDGQKVTVTAKRLLNEIVDSQGRQRFAEYNGVGNEIQGVTITYCKASLSGTHIMFVVCGTAENGAVFNAGTNICYYPLASWIYSKIKPVWASNVIETKSLALRGDDWSTQSVTSYIYKSSGGTVAINIGGASAVTMTSKKYFRLQFDLLIDTD